MHTEKEIENIARVCHEANRTLCSVSDGMSHSTWDESPENIKQSAIDGVKFHLENDVTPQQSHENWVKFKVADGWVYGETKDADAKTHPCLVDYDSLPEDQKKKDYLFKAIVDALR